MDNEVGLVPLNQATIQTMSRSVLFYFAVVKSTPRNTMHAGISVSLAVLITSKQKHRGNSAGMHMWLSQITYYFEY